MASIIKKKILLFLTTFVTLNFYAIFLVAQTHQIDSLENVLNQHKVGDTIRVNLFLEIANKTYNVEIPKTLEYAYEANRLSKKLNFLKGEAESFRLIGIAYYFKSDYPRAFEFYNKSLDIAEDIGNEAIIAKCYNNIGLIYWRQGNYEQAIEYSENSLTINEKLGNNLEIAWCFNNLGGIYYSQKDYSKAIESYQKSLEIVEVLDNKKIMSYCLRNIGLINLDKGDYDESLDYFQKSLDISEKIGDKFGICRSYLSFGNIFLQKKEYQKALDYTLLSLDYAKKLEVIELLMSVRKQLSEIYAATNYYKKAYENHLLYKELSDSIFSEKNSKKIAIIEYQYKYEKEKHQIELEQQKKDAINIEEAKRQRIIRNSLFLGVILLSLILLIIYRSFLQKKNANRTLALQKKEIEEKNEELYLQKAEIQEQAEELEVTNQELEKLSIVASETDNAVLIMDKNGKFEWANEGFSKLYGYSLAEFSIKYPDILSVNSNPKIKQNIKKCINQKETFSYESVTESRLGDRIWVQTTLTPILNQEGEIKKIIAIDSDITKLKAVEKELKFKNYRITASIRVAKTIQSAILPRQEQISKFFENFILFRPKDIVSGDFYWHIQTEKYHFIAAVDCTGHGVPGAFMSMIGSSLLNQVILEEKEYDTAEIIQKLDDLVVFSLRQKETDNNDGMELCFCKIEKKDKITKIQFTGTKRPLYYIKKNSFKIQRLLGDRKTVGGVMERYNKVEYTAQNIELEQGDTIYLSSDGFTDQNNTERRRFGTTRLVAILEEITNEPLENQHKILSDKLDDWMKGTNQRDDITLLGIKM